MRRRVNIMIALTISLSLMACVTVAGHRQIIKEKGLYLEVTAPTKEIKQKIRFNAEQTQLEYLPEGVFIRLSLTDSAGAHHVTIKGANGKPEYEYKVDGRQATFGPKAQDWFASQLPNIISKSGIGVSPLETDVANN